MHIAWGWDWFRGWIGVSAALAVVFGVAGYAYNHRKLAPRRIRAGGFNGFVRDVLKPACGIGMISGIGAFLSPELGRLPDIRAGLYAVAVISVVAGFAGLYLYSATDTMTVQDGKALEVRSIVWFILHGVIFGLLLGAMLTLAVTLFRLGMAQLGNA